MMNLLKKLKWEYMLFYIFITHDLALASELADVVAIMYTGKMVEIGVPRIFIRIRAIHTHRACYRAYQR